MLPIPSAASNNQPPDFRAALKRYWNSIPLATSTIVVVCFVLHIFSWVARVPMSYRCLGPRTPTAFSFLLSPLMHIDVIHLLFNMLAMVGVGGPLEMQRLGTAGLMAMCVIGMYLLNIIVLLEQFVLFGLLDGICLLGFSGVIFGLIGFDAYDPHAGPPEQRSYSLFGCFSIPVQYFPWVLLLITAVIFPHSSFIGHLNGVVVGMLVAWYVPRSFWTFWDLLVPLDKMFGKIPSPRDSAKYFLPATTSQSGGHAYSRAGTTTSSSDATSGNRFPMPGIVPPPSGSDSKEQFPGRGRVLGVASSTADGGRNRSSSTGSSSGGAGTIV